MEKNKNNPVEGRLSIPSPTKTEPHTKFTRKKTNYGFERLGITSDAEPKSDKPVSELSEKQKPPPLHTIAAPPITVSPVSKKPARRAESDEAVETEHRYAISSKLSRYKNILGRKKTKKILLLAGIPVIALTLILWLSSDDGKTTPQSASATDQSHSDQTARKHATGNATKPTKRPTKPAVVKMPQHAELGQAIPAATPAKSTIREIFKFLAEMKPEPKTTASVPAQAAPPQKPDKPKDADPKPVAKTAPVISMASSQLGLRLGGIMRGSDGKFALINNRSVKVGQTVNNAKVVHIGDFSVEVELNGKRYLVAISTTLTEKTSYENEDEDESSDSDDDKAESKTKDEEE